MFGSLVLILPKHNTHAPYIKYLDVAKHKIPWQNCVYRLDLNTTECLYSSFGLDFNTTECKYSSICLPLTAASCILDSSLSHLQS